MKDEQDRTEEIPVFQEENNSTGPGHDPEEPHRTINWSHIAILLGILAGVVIIILSLTIYIRSTMNAADAADSEPSSEAAASPTPKATEATDFYTGDDDSEATASPSASAKAKASADADKDKDDEVPADLSLIKSYDNIHLNNGISVTAKASSGTFEVVATDQDGNTNVIFNENGPFDKSDVRTDLGEGTYTIALYGDATGWSWSYSTY